MNGLFTEVECCQVRKHTERICGDAFASSRSADGRIISVLSDGLGSGVKAGILASMTARMALKFAFSDMDFQRSARVMIEALPVCSVRKIGYATYTIADCRPEGRMRVIEQGNPPFMLVRGGGVEEVPFREWRSHQWEHRAVRLYEWEARPEDRLVIFSDGVTESGMGSEAYGLGWRRSGCACFVQAELERCPTVSARRLAEAVVREARRKEPDGRAGDDISCAVIYLRRPRRALLLSGPPFDAAKDALYGELLRGAEGRKIICGGTSAEIASRELGVPITTDLKVRVRGLPPLSHMEGVDLVTEGILTLTEALRLLEQDGAGGSPEEHPSPAGKLVDMLRESDCIDLVIGTRINEAHQDPRLPVELDIRRNLVRRIAAVLENRYLKEVHIQFV